MKTLTQHTPGPWKSKDCLTYSHHTPRHVEVRGPNGVEAIADCFYAAPELLEAVQRCLGILEDVVSDNPLPAVNIRSNFQGLRALIIKAGGEQ